MDDNNKGNRLQWIVIGMQFVVIVAGGIAWWTNHEQKGTSTVVLQERMIEENTKAIQDNSQRIFKLEQQQHDNLEKYLPDMREVQIRTRLLADFVDVDRKHPELHDGR